MSEQNKMTEQLEFVTESGCWLWSGTENGDGYGIFRLGGKNAQWGSYIALAEGGEFQGPLTPGEE